MVNKRLIRSGGSHILRKGVSIFGMSEEDVLRLSKVHSAVNWNKKHDEYTQEIWNTNLKQMWQDTEFTPSKDKKSWNKLSKEMKEAYKKVLGGLTLLDTKQANVGMPRLAEFILDLQRRAVLSFQGMMEHIHAKSYSTIFVTILSNKEIDDLYEWIDGNPFLQTKADIITKYYDNIHDKRSLYMALVASVFLESFLFYSGFFLPLWLSGQGKMVASGEIIKKIVQDESVHGGYCGMLAQELFEELTEEEQVSVKDETYELLNKLMENEKKYTDYIYAPIGLESEVKRYVKFNANNALNNLGYDTYYQNIGEVNAIVLNGLNTESENNDQFSTKGKSYVVAVVEPLQDKDFDFSQRKSLLTV